MKQSCVICLECGTILVSLSVHDYRTCGCPQDTMIDGGFDYLRCGGMSLKLLEAGVWDTETNQFDGSMSIDQVKQELPKQPTTRWPY